MKIHALNLYIVELPFRLSFNHSLAKRSYSTNLIVQAVIETPGGNLVTGYGEGIPREYVTGETIEQASNLLIHSYFPHFLEKSFSNAPELVDALAKEFTTFALEEQSRGASWCALELALLDAACKSDQIALAQLMETDDTDRSVSGIRYGAVASLTNKKSLVALLTFFKLYGFTTVKLKIGQDMAMDLERIGLARRIMGRNATIRVDANCAWSVADTIEFAEASQAFNIASIEQPLRADDIDGLCQLASSIPQAIVVDESLCTVRQAENFVKRGIKVDFNIRLSKLGGLIASNRIRNIAKEAGISCHLGAQVGESGILTMASRIFGMSKGPFVNYEGAANCFLLKHDLTKENLTFGYGGWGRLPGNGDTNKARVGIGTTINEANFSKLITKKHFDPSLISTVVGR